MRIAILYDAVETRPQATADERGVLEAVDAVDSALRGLGHWPIRVAVGRAPLAWLARLEAARCDAAFNLCEGVGGRASLEAAVAAAVELLGVPLTGSSAETLALARRKDRVNALLEFAGLPVPRWQRERDGDPPAEWATFPAIVKPAGEDGSVGITQDSVVHDRPELHRAWQTGARYAPLLVQQLVGQREVNVGVVGAHVLPLSEIVFEALPAGASPIVSYAGKWHAESAEDQATRPVCPAPLTPPLAARLTSLALQAWSLIGGAGYGRVDLRLDDDGSAYVLDVNPNADLAPSAGLARMADAAGWTYAELIAHVLAEARP
ncbi:MAG: D-alanine--D-alanine ligase family protein [Longimicrobiales bacterium]